MNDQTQENQIRLVVLADHGLFRAGLGRLLASEPDIEVVGECATSVEALEVLKRSTVGLVLLDFDVGTERGNDFISAARQAGYQGRFLIVAASADVRDSSIGLKLGASGIFLKSETPDRLVQAIRLVGNGGIWLDQRIIQLLADQLIHRSPGLENQRFSGPLESHEQNVILGILGGLTNRKIGAKMGLSESSVKHIVQRLFGRAGVKTRSQLARVALQGPLRAAQELVQRKAHEKPYKPQRPPAVNLPSAK
jgi:two-component system, NarL family, nitrate/nitrite response regulator NarL